MGVRIFRALAERWRERKHFGSFGSFLWFVYDRVLHRLPNAPLPWRGSVQGVMLAHTPARFFVPLGTTDFHVVHEIYMQDEYKSVLDRELGEAPLIVNLGANVGLSIRCWLERWPDARIVAVEPDSANAAICRRNIEASPSPGSVTLVEACIAAQSRRVKLNRTGGEWGFSMGSDVAPDTAGANGDEVDAVTLPALLEKLGHGGRDVSLLKCDIEGSERELFAHCAEWLPRVRLAVVELHGEYDECQFTEDIARTGERFSFTRQKVMPGAQVIVMARGGERRSECGNC